MKQILIVDDSMLSRKKIAKYIESQGHHVITACNGIEALNTLEQHEIALIVSDINMPEMDGREFFEKLLESRANSKNVPIVFLSSMAHSKVRKELQELGALAVIEKKSLQDLDPYLAA
ncbi:response regulator [Pseudobacteriovorax antillogorgiicola]|uniref:Two-component system, chemotaxis family, response regulator CheY n=1 Tax=Pseudobacteriovorax antillogorgiicola TaxID=1513793 RepID=A0A1Y6CLV8_9BACT|nr:response regulator [Pseudobacteriovorax antillogorgiicola]TCS45014.1 two-component system chemotaxis response regulator CheY [Pseudobacteriovorax antillogorgiicola]SMF76364.1 two-component system, chemotaxis family, response regulator CheY [Pseudobacteriovorax antillogorgiicola]